jgi:hypothetical protein
MITSPAIPARRDRERVHPVIRSRGGRQAGMSDHYISSVVLLHTELRGGSAQTAVGWLVSTLACIVVLYCSTFVSQMRRPFHLRYNAYTESVEVLNNKRTLTLAVNSLRSDINILAAALHNIL